MSGLTPMDMQRMRLTVRGLVQGVGFRPFVHQLAEGMGLGGRVRNTVGGVVVEVEGPPDLLHDFHRRLLRDIPPPAQILTCEVSWLDPAGFLEFSIEASDSEGPAEALVLPDLATCPACFNELMDATNRRYRYPFTNCTRCGPRFSILERIPYDRPNTSMKGFVLCPDCRREYEDPADRRFHAQPNACPCCGPQLALWDTRGTERAQGEEALAAAVGALQDGLIVAVKGLGGFQLMVDARDDDAVLRLRQRKHREEKPLAVMYRDVERLRIDARVSEEEERLLRSSQAPIVLLDAWPDNTISDEVAPGQPCLGAMLPTTPLHHLLLGDLDPVPVVATSGNCSDEPMCIDEHEALERLQGIADIFLVHNRPIVRHVDDSLVRMQDGREMILRRARGYAPAPIVVPWDLPPTLAVGGHLKNAVALARGREVILSQHIGDLETPQARSACERVAEDLQTLFQITPERVVRDLHPDYVSTRLAAQTGLPETAVQHHYAHVLAAMAENELEGPVFGVSWDGTGYGTDSTVWGGEFLEADLHGFIRRAHLRPYRLPGSEQAVKEPRRCALGALYTLSGDALFEASAEEPPLSGFDPEEQRVLRRMLDRGVNCPLTTSVGRLFDAAASLCGLRDTVAFEGQAAMELEAAAHAAPESSAGYPCPLTPMETGSSPGTLVADWAAVLTGLRRDRAAGLPIPEAARKFHVALADLAASAARHVGLEQVVLTGGCFQNRLLTTLCRRRLERDGFRVYLHQRVPPGDGGLALGQAIFQGIDPSSQTKP